MLLLFLLISLSRAIQLVNARKLSQDHGNNIAEADLLPPAQSLDDYRAILGRVNSGQLSAAEAVHQMCQFATSSPGLLVEQLGSCLFHQAPICECANHRAAALDNAYVALGRDEISDSSCSEEGDFVLLSV